VTPLSGFRARLHSDDVLLAALLSVPDPGVAAIVGRSGFDFVMVDCEHGPFTLSSLRLVVEALEPTPAAIVVRPAANDPALVKQVLELGVDGVQLPTVSSAAEAEAAVSAARFAPEGRRGVGLGRWGGYGANLPGALLEANASTAVIVMIEDAAGVENAAAIAAVEGVDGIVIGPFDLSASLGVPGEPGHPLVQEALGLVVDAAVAAGVAVGTACAPDEAADFTARGMRILNVFVDVLALAAAAEGIVKTVRG
jgi:2-keto-3-deoxy-L-rhamnonate aldolase RhmA